MRKGFLIQNALLGASALVIAAGYAMPDRDHTGPVLNAAATFVNGTAASASSATATVTAEAGGEVVGNGVEAAVNAFSGVVRGLSRPEALETAFKSYFAFKSAHPDEVRKPYLYFVDFGLPATAKRGYVFDMEKLQIVEGPFTVAAGKGSQRDGGTPTKFSNAARSAASSLGLYVTKALYAFSGHSGGRAYNSVGLRLDGKSTGFNDNALARGVVAHGAPYVTPNKAGRSQGCPAMEPSRAARLLPKLANGAVTFLFAPDKNWMSKDPWVTARTS
jgi:hypothetical protein